VSHFRGDETRLAARAHLLVKTVARVVDLAARNNLGLGVGGRAAAAHLQVQTATLVLGDDNLSVGAVAARAHGLVQTAAGMTRVVTFMFGHVVRLDQNAGAARAVDLFQASALGLLDVGRHELLALARWLSAGVLTVRPNAPVQRTLGSGTRAVGSRVRISGLHDGRGSRGARRRHNRHSRR